MIDKLTKIQLSIFAIITVLTLTVMGIFYLRLPATFGIGTYEVSADFVAGGACTRTPTSPTGVSRSGGWNRLA